MTEEEVFLAVLDLTEPADRNAYLDRACGRDAEFRRQVEELLAAHFKSGDFLDEPLGQQMAAGLVTPVTGETVALTDRLGGVGVVDEKQPVEQLDDLQFLQPSNRPGSLGRIGHYEVLKVLGKGGFGIVLRAFDETLQREVALKVLAPAIAATSPARKRFLREARSAAQIRHEHVVQVHAVEEQPLPYLVMEFIPGETLQQRLDRTGPLEAAEIVRLGRQIAEGLAAAHTHGLIHRDIKPGNVLIEAGAQERIKITDFGLARTADDASQTQSGVLAGTPMYMAPEQARGETLDHRADLFSLGSVLYVMASGRPPFRASTTYAVLKRVAEDTPRPIREVIPEVPQGLCDIIARLHAKKPEDRYQSARKVADVLADCAVRFQAGAGPKDFCPVRPGKLAEGRSGRWKWFVVAALLLPVLALALTEITGRTHWLRKPTPTPDPRQIIHPAEARETPFPPEFKNSIGMKFVLIPRGKFFMGGSGGKVGDQEVDIPHDFYLGQYEVTQDEWFKVMGTSPSSFSRTGEDRKRVVDIDAKELMRFPVESVSWFDTQDFAARLNELEKPTGWKYRLPTVTEWEYACRGGPLADKLDYGFDYYFDQPTNTLAGNQANFKHENSLQRTAKVGTYPANRLGLHDMHGNVFEWLDDPPKPDIPGHRVAQGGSWSYDSGLCQAGRYNTTPGRAQDHNFGFRLARVPVEK